MISVKTKTLVKDLMCVTGGDPIEWTAAYENLVEYVSELEEMLKWYVEEDEINEGDPDNQYWIDGKHKAMKLLGMEIGE